MKTKAQLLAERNAEIRRMREAGMTQQAIADEVGLSQQAVAKVVQPKTAEKERVVKPKRQNIYLPPQPEAAAARIRKTFGDPFADALKAAL